MNHWLTSACLLALMAMALAADARDRQPTHIGKFSVKTLPDNFLCQAPCANGSNGVSPGVLGIVDVQRVIAQAVAEANALNHPATIAVVDRVGNVLGVFQMNGAETSVTITSGRGVSGGLEGLEVIPSTLAAIAKAMTGAYLSSSGNAFTSRTASQIVQQHFNPGELGMPGGPLFGVQFSQLACSDLSSRFQAGVDAGPKRSPLGLSADPGGLPLYRNGQVIGGVGVVSDPVYGLDPNIWDVDRDDDELIALAATRGFAAPTEVKAERISVDGRTLRYTDAGFDDLRTGPNDVGDFSIINGVEGNLVAVTAYSHGLILQGTEFGRPASGIRPDRGDYPGLDARVLVDRNRQERFPPRAGTDGADALTEDEVRTLVQQALGVANRARAQIRRPLGDYARVTISVVDTNGEVLAIARSRDAPVFGIDVSLQKARTAAFFSNTGAADDLDSAPNTIYLNPNGSPSGQEIVIGDYVQAVRAFIGQPTALANGLAVSDRAGGNLSRPFYPDGIDGAQAGPFSKPFGQWSPFSVGLQLDLALNQIAQHVVHVLTDGGVADTPQNCTSIDRLPNGIQIFPGSVPIYRGNTLVGGIGVSGDGIDPGRPDRLPGPVPGRSDPGHHQQCRPRDTRRPSLRRRAPACVTCSVRSRRSTTAMNSMSARTSRALVLAILLANSPPASADPQTREDWCGRAECEENPDEIRRRPGDPVQQAIERSSNPKAVPRLPYESPDPGIPIPDRWRLMDTLGLTNDGAGERWYEPYHVNTYKADKPVHGDWFLNLLAVSDTVIEPRSVPTPVGPQSAGNPGSLNGFGGNDQFLAAETLLLGAVYYKGKTVFKPPDYEYRLTLALNYNYAHADETRFLFIDPRDGRSRNDSHVGLQELFFDKHLRNVSKRYDFDSFRIGIQPFTTDFRGFLFLDQPFGLRLFGTRDNNLWQYNIAWFRRFEKDTNSGLNDPDQGLRDDDIFVANAYRQDWPTIGFTTQGTLLHNRNRETDVFFDNNGFLARPLAQGQQRTREYDVTYLGLSGDGHIGRLNLSVSAYLAYGEETGSTFVNRESDIRAGFVAAEAGMDFSWIRTRFSALWASGDDDPFDDESNGFDAVLENPQFAGANTSYWIRQNVPFIGGGVLALSTRNGILASLRSSREHGQSNFTNPGLRLLGAGADLDLTPQTRVSANLNALWFDDTSVLEAARHQASIDRDIGVDASLAVIWRPLAIQNIVFSVSAAALRPGDGFEALFGDDIQYSVLANLVLSY